jgi:hypothetical protein
VAVIGAGGSSLVVALLAAGYQQIVAVDIARPGLQQLVERVPADQAVALSTVVADVRLLHLDEPVQLWHDRATLHFLLSDADRAAYAEVAQRSIVPGGLAVIATFALDGPQQCSGLDVRRYDVEGLASMFADGFELVDSLRHVHLTPWGAEQPFTYVVLRRR